MAENAEGYVTKSDLLQTEKEAEKISPEIKDTNNKVDGLEQLILPWAKSLSNIERNTERMADNYEQSNKKQDKILEKQHELDKRLGVVEGDTTVRVARMGNKTKILVAGIGILGSGGGFLYIFGERIANAIFGG